MKRDYSDSVNDIIDAMNKATEFVKGISYEKFIEDEKTIFAVVRALEIIGEAVKNIPETVRSKYPKIPWQDMAGMRDILIHEYFEVDISVLWNTVTQDIPKALTAMRHLRTALKSK